MFGNVTLSTGIALNKSQSAYPHLWDGLVGLWSPDLGKQGDRLYDFSHTFHDAILTNMNAETDYVSGKFGYALNFDGADDYLHIGNVPEIDDASQDLTFAYWIKTETAQTNNAMFMYDTNDALSPGTDIYCMFKGNLTIGGVGDSGEWNTGYASSNFQDGKWHHIVIILEGGNEYVYDNAKLVASRAVAHNHANYGASHNFRIADNSNVGHYIGDIGTFLLYNRALKPHEVIELYSGASPLQLSLPSSFPGAIPSSIPFLDGYTKRRKITIDSASIDETLTDFASLVKLEEGLNFDFADANPDGSDIRFTSDDGQTLLDFEREFHDTNTKLLLHFNGTNGQTSTEDSSQHKKAVTFVGGAQLSTTEKKFGSSSIFFDGVDSKITLADSSDWNFGASDFTVDFWLNLSSLPSGGQWYGLFHQSTDFNDNDNIRALIRGSDKSFELNWTYNGTTINAVNYPASWNTGQWYHIVVTRDGDFLRVYRDGIQLGSTNIGTNALFDSTADFEVGFVTTPHYLHGYVDEFRVTTGQAVYKAPFPPPTAEFAERAYYWVKHPLVIKDKAAVFDGVDDYLSIPNSSDFDFGSGDFTVETWINFSSFSGDPQIFFSAPIPGAFAQTQFGYGTTSNKFYLFSTGPGTIVETSAQTLSLDTWYHVAWVREGNDWRIYVDGVKQGETLGNSTTLATPTGNIFIAAEVTATSQEFFGRLDEYRISKGIARYTSDFTPQVTEHEPDANTHLLLHFHDNYVDSSASAHTVTPNGNTNLNFDGKFVKNTEFFIYYGNQTVSDALYSDDLTNPAETSTRAFADSEFNGSHLDDSAFDDNRDGASNRWAANGGPWPHWIGWDFGVGDEQVINTYEILPRNDGNWFEVPKDWKVQGSNDSTNGTDGTWIDLDVRTGEVFTQGVARFFSFQTENKTAYRWYRIRGTANQTGGNTNMALTEVQFLSGFINPEDVWSSDHKLVMHMADETDSTVKDSTSNNNDGNKETGNQPIELQGGLGPEQHFREEYSINVPNDSSINLTSPQSIHMWFNWDGPGADTQELLTKWRNPFDFKITLDAGGLFRMAWAGNFQGTGFSNTFLNDGQDHLVDVVVDAGQTKVYIDNAIQETISGTPGGAGGYDIGSEGASAIHELNGSISEFRVSNIAKSDARRKAEFLSENGTLLSIGSQETTSGTTQEIVDEMEDITLSDTIEFAGTQTLDLNESITLSEASTIVTSGPAPFLSGYTKRKLICIDSSKINSDLTDFPILVKLDSENFNFSKSLPDGADIRFTTDDGTTLLKYEREFHGPTGVGPDTTSEPGLIFNADSIRNDDIPSYGPANAFDDDESGVLGADWQSKFDLANPFPHWLTIDYGIGNEKTIVRTNINPDFTLVRDFEIGGSNLASPDGDNDGDWTLIFAGTHSGTADTKETFNFSNATAYRHYRIKVLNRYGAGELCGVHEIEMFEGANSEAYYWVKIPTVQSAQDTFIYLYYDDPTAIDGADPENVWDSNYEAIWHLKENPTGSVGEILDSTSNNHDGQGIGTLPTQIDTLIYKGLQGQGTNSYISFPDSDGFHLSGDFTLEWKMRWNGSVTNGSIMGQSQGGGSNPKWILNYGNLTPGNMQLTIDLGASNESASFPWSPVADVWYHCVLKRTGNNVEFFVNNTQIGTTQTITIVPPNVTTDFRLFNEGESWQWFAGDMDEARISKGLARSDDYIQAAYESDRDNLIFLGQQESTEPTPFLTGYVRRRKLTIDSTKIDSHLTDLVALVKLEDGVNFNFSDAKSDGTDIRFTAADGETLLDYEREFHGEPPPVISGDITGSGTASASSFFSGAFDPENPVDDLLTTSWLSDGQSPASAEWWQYDFGAGNEKVIVRYTLEYNLNLFQALTDWQFEGSNDTVQWTVLDTQSGFTFQAQTKETFNFSNSTAYRYYRINVIDSVEGNFCDFSEIEMMENLSAKEGYYWVRIPSVFQNSDTDFYIYYGDPTASDGANPTAVWSSDHKAVYHLKDDFLDSTSNDNDLTNGGTSEVDGQIYTARQFGNPLFLEANDDPTLDITNAIRLRAWVKASTYNQSTLRIVEKAGTSDSIYLLGVHNNSVYFGLWNSGAQTFFLDGGTLTDGQAHHLVAEWDGVNMKAYIDGVEVKNIPFSGPIDTSNETLNIGRRKNPSPLYWGANDYIDEVRVGDTAKGAAHAKAEYHTENNDLLTFGQEEVSVEIVDITDDITLSDAAAFSITKNVDLAENITLSDQAVVENFEVNETEDIELSDSIQLTQVIDLPLTESITLGDSESIFTAVAVIENEDLTVTDAIELIRTVFRIIDEQETITLSDDIDMQLSSSFQDNITLSDSSNIFRFLSTVEKDNITLSDQIEFASGISLNLSEQITLSDQGVFSPSDEEVNETEDIEVMDEINVFATTGTAKNASRIISYNPLVIVSDSVPMRIVRVDTSNPSSPTWQVFTFSSLSNAKDVVYNAVFDLVYVACADGKILKLDGSDFGISEIIDTGDSNDLNHIAQLDDFHKIYAATNDPTGEVLYLDEAEIATLNLDIQVLSQVNSLMDLDIRTNEGGILSTDIQCLGTETSSFGLDIRVIAFPFNEIALNPIKQTDFDVRINGSTVDDVQLDSIRIYHAIGEKSTATFTVKRRHDELDTTFNGQGSQITNQNSVQVFIQGNQEFSGNVSRIRTNSENETVEVTAQGTEKSNDRRTITVPLASVNEKLHPYHCLVDNEDIFNPIIDPLDEDPEFFLGVEVDLGLEIVQSNSRWLALFDVSQDLIDGTFQPKQNWTYFWFCKATNFLTGIKQGSTRYVGTSPATITGDLWGLDFTNYRYQREFNDKETELGIFQVGSPPYKTINARNGCKFVKSRWVDREDGMYREKDSGYDYVQYVKDVAQLEFEKLQNVNGSILPITSCDIELMVDGYYYYNPLLLTRINIDNTTTGGIYKNNNGFPVAIKSIEITSRDMRVALKCDNEKSDVELAEIDDQFPDPESDEYLFVGESVKQFSKFDYSRFESVQ